MRVLVACEFSGTVRDAFIHRGHDAWSCDLLPSDAPGPHLKGDVLERLTDGWDLMIAHPPCTYLTVSGLHWNTRRPERAALTEDALVFVQALFNAPIEKIALENPIGLISTRIRKPDQIIQPWMFGHDASKATCLWLKNLPALQETDNVRRPAWIRCPDGCDEWYCQRHGMHAFECDCSQLEDWTLAGDDPYRVRYANQTPSGQNKLGPSADRWKLRSKTYEGIADAMATQWGTF
jgi:hypothetical protein